MPYFETSDGTQLFYKDIGSGPPVVLVHSWSLSSDMWEYQIPALVESGYRCIAMDRRGHGRSDASTSGYGLTLMADDLAALIDRLDLRGATMLAHSMGTCETVRYLGRRGSDRVARAILLGSMTPYLEGAVGREFVDAWITQLRTDRPRWFQESAPAYFAREGTGSWVSDALIADGVVTILRTPLEVQIDCVRTLTGTDLTGDLSAIDVPVLLVHGDADASAPIDITARPTAKLLARSELVVYEGAGHGLYVSDKDRLHPAILEFVGRA
jgi:pimeloyl-ACP methyl ester carboxylesterase